MVLAEQRLEPLATHAIAIRNTDVGQSLQLYTRTAALHPKCTYNYYQHVQIKGSFQGIGQTCWQCKNAAKAQRLICNCRLRR